MVVTSVSRPTAAIPTPTRVLCCVLVWRTLEMELISASWGAGGAEPLDMNSVSTNWKTKLFCFVNSEHGTASTEYGELICACRSFFLFYGIEMMMETHFGGRRNDPQTRLWWFACRSPHFCCCWIARRWEHLLIRCGPICVCKKKQCNVWRRGA